MSIQTSVNKEQSKSLNRLSLRANFSWTFVGNILYTGTQWGLLVLLTKLFEPDVFGRYALALSIVTPIFAGSALQLRVLQATDVAASTPFSDYFLLRLITNLLSLILTVILVLLGLVNYQYIWLTLLLGLNQVVMLTQDVYQGYKQNYERMDLVAIAQIIHGFVSLIVAAIVALLTRNILLVVIGMISARMLALLIYDAPKAQQLRIPASLLVSKQALLQSLHSKRLILLARAAWPLGIVTLLLSLYLNIPRYFLASSGEAVVGFFSATASLVALQELVMGALGQSAIPRLAQYFDTDRNSYIRLVLGLCLIGLAIGVAGLLIAIVFGHALLALLFRKEYAQFADVFVWLMAGKIVVNLSSAVSYGITAARIFRPQVWIQITSLASLIATAWFLVPVWTGLGAAWSMLISACVMLVASIVVLIRAFHST